MIYVIHNLDYVHHRYGPPTPEVPIVVEVRHDNSGLSNVSCSKQQRCRHCRHAARIEPGARQGELVYRGARGDRTPVGRGIDWLARRRDGLELAQVYRGTAEGIPTIQFGILIPILVGVLLLRRSATMSHLVDAIPQPWIVAIQFYRVLGLTFLLLYAAGQMPGLFA